ncbi:hypothetical protein [Marinagarivorans cellulosilyticus]|uniref:Uncharacterized protein n=1 Tax=Marinagarivorans cellulosilyticus TaxID=2721545 RepID=A0AAN2BK80_9GAMM|nr:hypothetical protein [Marinagarivorans cellulosilyticus]BCD97726.1 hypothetical protein MARGE09_P1927 [Marinagarivorans cellulosilyticus]
MNAIAERATNSIKRLWSLVVYAFQSPAQDSHSKRRTAILFSLALVVHLIVLPAHVLGSDIGLRSFAHLNLSIALFAFLFATLESVLINLWVQLISQKTHCRTAPAAGGMLIGLVSPLLCCTPLLPTILSFVAILFPSAVSGMGLKIQYAVNVYQTELLLLALVLLLFAIAQNAWYLKSSHTMAGHHKE